MEWLIIPGMAVLNRASGMDEWFPGRNIYATSILAGLLGWFLLGPLFGLCLFLGMLTYRILGWWGLLDIGADKGSPVGEFLGMWARSLLFFPPYIYLAWAHPLQPTLVWWVLSGLGCAIGYTVGMWAPHKLDRGLVAEVIAGAAMGGCLFGAFHA